MTMQSEIGRQIGRFRLLSVLGTGGFATVYRAEDTQLGREVAIKLLHPHLAADDAFISRFRAEARANARLRHPHIVTIYEVGETEDGRGYLVMELLQGTLLSKLVARSAPFSVEQAVAILSQLATALDYIHAQGLIHRDLKPSNVMVSETGDVTLMDFGIARSVDEQAGLTATGQMVGTPVYMAPEQISGEKVGPPADLYAFGILGYELLAGRPPFTGSVTTIIHNQLNTAPPPLHEFNATIPPSAAQALELMLSKDPAARPPTATAFVDLLSGKESIDDLKTAVFNGGTTTAPAGPVQRSGRSATLARPAAVTQAAPATEKRQLARGLLLSGGAAAAALAAVLLWLFLAGPLAGGDGTLSVTSVPAGAAVSVDGKPRGSTPLAQLSLPAGAHTLILDKPGYRLLRTTVKISARSTTPQNLTLDGLPVVEKIDVLTDSDHQFIATGVSQDASGKIHYQTKVSQVRVGQAFSAIVSVAQKFPEQGELPFQYQFKLYTAVGEPFGEGPKQDAKLAATNTRDNPLALSWSYSFTANPDGSVRTGGYFVKLEIDGKEVATLPIEVIR